MPPHSQFSYRTILSHEYFISLATALMLLSLAFAAQHFAHEYSLIYSARPTYIYVGDVFLDNLPVVDLNWLIVEGGLLAMIVSTAIVLKRPRYILFSIKTVALFVLVRAFFISLTHVGIYPGHVIPGPGYIDAIYTQLNLETGYFFSGHTGLPFLMGLVFWQHRYLRHAFFILSGVFAVAVLLAHVHYSIDVFAAPFLAYGVFKIAQFLFPEDYHILRGKPSVHDAPNTLI